MTNNKDQLSKLYRQQAQDKAPEHLNESVLTIAAKKSERLAEKNTKTHSFGRIIAFKKSHWLGVSSACCLLILSLSIFVPMTQTPLHQSPTFENNHATVSTSERTLKQHSVPHSYKNEALFDGIMDADQSPEITATATPSAEPVKASAQNRRAQQQRSKPTVSTTAPKARSFSAPPNLPKEKIAAEQDMIISNTALTNPPLKSSELTEQYKHTAASSRTAAQWLEIIKQRVTAKDFDAARLAVENFSRDFPDYKQPDNWKVWLHTD
jgi:hypothetical protein